MEKELNEKEKTLLIISRVFSENEKLVSKSKELENCVIKLQSKILKMEGQPIDNKDLLTIQDFIKEKAFKMIFSDYSLAFILKKYPKDFEKFLNDVTIDEIRYDLKDEILNISSLQNIKNYFMNNFKKYFDECSNKEEQEQKQEQKEQNI